MRGPRSAGEVVAGVVAGVATTVGPVAGAVATTPVPLPDVVTSAAAPVTGAGAVATATVVVAGRVTGSPTGAPSFDDITISSPAVCLWPIWQPAANTTTGARRMRAFMFMISARFISGRSCP